MSDYPFKAEHRQWERPCGPCLIKSYDYKDLDGGLPRLMRSIFARSEDALGISSTVEVLVYDPENNMILNSERVIAALKCAERVVSGGCDSYYYIGG